MIKLLLIAKELLVDYSEQLKIYCLCSLFIVLLLLSFYFNVIILKKQILLV